MPNGQRNENALRNPDDFTSAKVIGDRLAAIEKDHKADYDEGMKAVLHPPAPAYLNPAMNPYGRFGLPGFAPPGSTPSPAPTNTPPSTPVAPPSSK